MIREDSTCKLVRFWGIQDGESDQGGQAVGGGGVASDLVRRAPLLEVKRNTQKAKKTMRNEKERNKPRKTGKPK